MGGEVAYNIHRRRSSGGDYLPLLTCFASKGSREKGLILEDPVGGRGAFLVVFNPQEVVRSLQNFPCLNAKSHAMKRDGAASQAAMLRILGVGVSKEFELFSCRQLNNFLTNIQSP